MNGDRQTITQDRRPPVPDAFVAHAREPVSDAPTPDAASLTDATADVPADLSAEPVAEPVAEQQPEQVPEHDLSGALEAVLLVVDAPVTETALATAVGHTAARVRQVLVELAAGYTAASSGIELREIGGGWRLYTRDRFAPVVERFVLDGAQSRLSRAALETLAIVAYRQPVTRARVAGVRGVNVDGVIRTLMSRGLIEDVGTDPDTGGLLYRTTDLFLERLGLSELSELPSLGPLLPDIEGIDDV